MTPGGPAKSGGGSPPSAVREMIGTIRASAPFAPLPGEGRYAVTSETTARDEAVEAGPEVTEVAAELRLVIGRLVRRLRGHRGTDITPSQLSALSNVEDHAPIRLRELARLEGVSAPTASRVVDALVAHDLVLRTTDPQDARGTLITLTPVGAESQAAWRRSRDAALTEKLSELSEDELTRLVAAIPVFQLLVQRFNDDVGAG